ncbi:MAG: cytochrome b/b6 domain-containing protein [Gaiellaceae bacterium]
MDSPALPERRYLRRFSRTERAVHWVHATAFFVLLGSGLFLYLPKLSELVSRRGLVKAIHIDAALAWIGALVLIVIVGDRRALRRTLRELEWFDDDDRRWLTGRRTPQGRFNAGQKLNAALTAAFAVLFSVSGFLLWYGERDTRFRFANTILIHDGLMYVSLFLLVGHLYLSLIYPKTRHALRGITLGTVREDWAREHHAKWVEAERSAASESTAPSVEVDGR